MFFMVGFWLDNKYSDYSAYYCFTSLPLATPLALFMPENRNYDTY